MNSISVKKAESGQVLAKKVQSDTGIVLANKGMEINAELLKQFENFGIRTIVVEDEGERRKVMLVDDNMTNLSSGKNMLKAQYRVYALDSAEAMFDLLDNVIPDIILLDIEMPGTDGYEAIKRLKSNPRWADIPVIFLTAKTDESSEFTGLSLGAIDYVTKPFSAPLLLKRIENHLASEIRKAKLKEFNSRLEKMVQKKTEQICSLQNAVLSTVADLVEFRDGVTEGHIARTQKYMEILVNKLIEKNIYSDEISKWDIIHMIHSVQLHDVGKIAISNAILNKPGKLTDDEFTVIKTHVAAGMEAIRKIDSNFSDSDFLKYAIRIAGSHHERWDGTGYPTGIAGDNIPLEGRLMAIADVYDALISVRPYKSAVTAEEARKAIADGKGTHFDPVLVDVFAEVADEFAAVARNF